MTKSPKLLFFSFNKYIPQIFLNIKETIQINISGLNKSEYNYTIKHPKILDNLFNKQ